MKKPKVEKLENRFNDFMKSRVESQDIDEMEIPEKFRELKRADYLINGDIIVELKSLENDPSSKVEKKLAPHRDRDEFPTYFWDAPIGEVLKHLPDGDKISKEVFFAITKSLQHNFEKADAQIRDTKTIINNPNATGVITILNENIEILEPKTIAYIAKYMMGKKNKGGSYRYKNIHFAYLISEAHFQQVNEGLIALPIILIEGPFAKDHSEAIDKFESYNHEWAHFNKFSLLKFSGSPVELLENAFRSFGEEPSKAQNEMKMHELWRSEYRANPYLNSISADDFRLYGEEVIEKMAPHFIKGCAPRSKEDTHKMMIVWTHFLEEAQIRNFNMKDLKPNIEGAK